MTAVLKSVEISNKAIVTTPGPQFYERDRYYVESVISALSDDVKTQALKNLAASGYLSGANSASARADDTFNW